MSLSHATSFVLMKLKCLSAYHGCLVSIESFHGRIVVPQLMHSHMRAMKLQLALSGVGLLGVPFDTIILPMTANASDTDFP